MRCRTSWEKEEGRSLHGTWGLVGRELTGASLRPSAFWFWSPSKL